MNDLDQNLKLLAGEAWKVKGAGKIYPPKLRDIADVGYSTYMQYVNFFTLDPKDILKSDDESENEELQEMAKTITGFDVIFGKTEVDISKPYLDAVKFFFRTDEVHYSKPYHQVHIGEINGPNENLIINSDNYNDIAEVTKILACLDTNKPKDDWNPADEKTAKAIEHIKKSREKLNEIKKRDGNSGGDNLFDIISAVSTRSNSLNKITIWDLTVYQLYDELKRLQLIDQYEIGILAMMQIGNKATVKHWSSKFQDE